MDLALLRAERMKRGITQEKLAKCLGFKDKSSYCLMEKGKDGWEIRVDTTPNLNSLRNLDAFDLLLLKLQRADVRIIADELSDEDDVYSDTKPEPTYGGSKSGK